MVRTAVLPPPPVHGCRSLLFRKVKGPDVEPSGVLLLEGPPGCPGGLQWLQLSSRLFCEHYVHHQPFQVYFPDLHHVTKGGMGSLDFMSSLVFQQWT